MDGAFAKAVVAKGLERQRAEGRALFRKHHGHLTLRGAVDARVRPVRLPAIEVGLRRLDRLEAGPLQRRFLGVADSGFSFPFPIGIADAAGQRSHAVMGEDIAIQRIEGGIVDVGREDTFAEIVEDNHFDRYRRVAETRARAAPPRFARPIATSAAARLSAISPT
jgi:hypothetical protein